MFDVSRGLGLRGAAGIGRIIDPAKPRRNAAIAAVAMALSASIDLRFEQLVSPASRPEAGFVSAIMNFAAFSDNPRFTMMRCGVRTRCRVRML
ncbi:hypothetical protein [Lysobacter enzymogenes]|uniref:hypothetical protein n=1 Tax=Lysobacter enzymogenes TaxID=69 RepID=UPI001AF7B5AA|nr:hypothetical protein [Lysobacter enzymogenes]QQQ01297.1 hypothetical protein JHW41_25215 [Lysobacter enzymogenes]